jgi:hypothetical protein
MAVSQVSLANLIVGQAYHKALLFDQMKKKKESAADAPGGETQESAPEKPAAELTPKEKPKPNTVPFKSGFAFEYAHDSGDGPVTIAIGENEKVKVDLKGGPDQDERKKTIRSLVMLGLGKIDRNEFNATLAQGKNKIENVTRELSLMGIKTELPFGLGDRSFYVDGRNQLAAYKPMDIKG